MFSLRQAFKTLPSPLTTNRTNRIWLAAFALLSVVAGCRNATSEDLPTTTLAGQIPVASSTTSSQALPWPRSAAEIALLGRWELDLEASGFDNEPPSDDRYLLFTDRLLPTRRGPADGFYGSFYDGSCLSERHTSVVLKGSTMTWAGETGGQTAIGCPTVQPLLDWLPPCLDGGCIYRLEGDAVLTLQAEAGVPVAVFTKVPAPSALPDAATKP